MLYALSSPVSGCNRPKPKTKLFFNYFKSFPAPAQVSSSAGGICRNQELSIGSAGSDAIFMALVFFKGNNKTA